MSAEEHVTNIHRSGSGLVGVCSCRHRQQRPVDTRQEAEDWCLAHKAEIERTRALLAKPLSDKAYLAHLRHQEETDPRNREYWKQLADEFEVRVKAKGAVATREPGPDDVPLF